MKKSEYNNSNKNKQTHRYREQTSGWQWGDRRGEGHDDSRGIKKYKLLSIR